MERCCLSVRYRVQINRLISLLVLAVLMSGMPAEAAGRFIVRVANGPAIQLVCLLTGFSVFENIDGSAGQLYVLQTPDALDPVAGLNILVNTLGVIAVEPDLIAHTADSAPAIPPALEDNTPTPYYGAMVPHGYVSQPATDKIRM